MLTTYFNKKQTHYKLIILSTEKYITEGDIQFTRQIYKIEGAPSKRIVIDTMIGSRWIRHSLINLKTGEEFTDNMWYFVDDHKIYFSHIVNKMRDIIKGWNSYKLTGIAGLNTGNSPKKEFQILCDDIKRSRIVRNAKVYMY